MTAVVPPMASCTDNAAMIAYAGRDARSREAIATGGDLVA